MSGVPVRLFMFDLDGTLVDSIGDIADGTNHMLATLGHPTLGVDQIRGLVGAGARKLVEGSIHSACGRVALPNEVDRGLALYVEYNHVHIADKSRLYPQVAETLRELHRRGSALAVVSNKNEALCRRALAAFGIEGLFVCVVGGDSLPERKPSAEPLFFAMKEAGLSRAEVAAAVMVGDSRFDLEAGRNAGVRTVMCSYGYGNPEELTPADLVIDDFSRLTSL